MWIKPITDRTQADVDYATENRNSVGQLKGARNHTDLQRITGNMYHLANLLQTHGYSVSALVSKSTWGLGEIPTYSEIEKIKTDVKALREAFAVFHTTPATPELPYTSYQKMNNVEQIILDINSVIEYMIASIYYSNQFYSGENTELCGIRFA